MIHFFYFLVHSYRTTKLNKLHGNSKVLRTIHEIVNLSEIPTKHFMDVYMYLSLVEKVYRYLNKILVSLETCGTKKIYFIIIVFLFFKRKNWESRVNKKFIFRHKDSKSVLQFIVHCLFKTTSRQEEWINRKFGFK